MGLTVSCDLNYRKNLWKWGKKAGEVMPELVALLRRGHRQRGGRRQGLRHQGAGVDVTAGKVEAEAYVYVCEELASRFPNLKTIAITLRGSLSASHNTWSGVLWEQGQFYAGPHYDITTSWTAWAAATLSALG